MAIPQTSGPGFVYIARIAPLVAVLRTDLYFLGTCEQPPTLQLNPQWEPIMNDVSGSLLPLDYSYQGEDGLLSGTFNKWNEKVYMRLASHALAQANVGGVGITPFARGFELWSDIGSIAQYEGLTFQTWIHFPYAAAKAIYGTVNFMPTCYHFLACRLAGHVIGPGTRANRRQLIFHADRANGETAVASTSGFRLYDNTLHASIPAVPPVTVDGSVPA